MAHIFDVISTVNGQLNILSKYYNEHSNLIRSLPNIPNFILGSLKRLICTSCADSVIDDNEEIVINVAVMADTGDQFNPVYICVVSNIKAPIIDKVPIIFNRGNVTGPGIAYIVYVPKLLFDEDVDIADISIILRKIYFGLISYDSNMTFSANPKLLNIIDGNTFIDSYDISMIMIAISAMHINLRSWFGSKGSALPATYALEAFKDDEISPKIKDAIIPVIENYGISIGNLRDSIDNGNLIVDVWEGISNISYDDNEDTTTNEVE
jgi:hypothetical protein